MKTWLITGCSSGFYHHVANIVAARGDRVATTARDPASLIGLVEAHAGRVVAAELEVAQPETAVAGV